MSAAAAPDAGRCPFVVIGGFLGAGKTTLLNDYLLKVPGRSAVLVNDFGSVNIDAGLVADHDGTTMRLTNGCVCCSIGAGLVESLMRVLSGNVRFDRIVIEASGVADPWRLAEIALVEPDLYLDAVIVVAEANRLPALLADARVGETVAGQVRAADLLVLNKVDLASAEEVAAARAAVRHLRPRLRIVETVRARLSADILAGVQHETVAPGRSAFRASPVDHDDTFRRYLYARQGAFEKGALEQALRGLPPSLLRLKGQVRIAGDEQRQLLQMVGERWELTPMPASADISDDPAIELVGIGTADLPAADVIDAGLDAARLAPAAPEPAGQQRRDVSTRGSRP